ncbi:MAG: alpha/beta hydrolase family protein [Candidatus Hermodarchaeota archaeon]
MEFKEKQFDGPYEVAEVEINNKGEFFKGLLYFPPERFKQPFSVVIYFHGFPQLFPLQEIVSNYKSILELGYVFLIFNFRGYRFSDGQVSINGQISDALKIIEFIRKFSKKEVFNLNDVNIIAHDFGAYIALVLCSKINLINRLLLLSPILNLKKHVFSEDFKNALEYINRYLPSNIKGVEKIDEFIKKTKKEASNKKIQTCFFSKHLKNKKLKIITGERDKITPINEIDEVFKSSNLIPEISIIKNMDHECIEEEDFEEINNEIVNFFFKINK